MKLLGENVLVTKKNKKFFFEKVKIPKNLNCPEVTFIFFRKHKISHFFSFWLQGE